MTKSKSRKPPARRGNSGRAGNGKGHNSDARAGTIRDVYKNLAGWESQCKALREKIKGEKQKRIKGDLGMTIKAFNAAVTLFNLEGDDRDQAVAAYHEVFEALGAKDTLDIESVLARMDAAATENVDEGQEAAASAAGPVGATA